MTLVCVFLGALLLAEPEAAPRPRVPLYTNEDLERVRPYRGQTGVFCVPAVAPTAPQTQGARRRAGRAEPDRASQERYWQRAAAQHRLRLTRLERAATTLRQRIDRLRRERSSPRGKDTTSRAQLEERLKEIESEIAQIESDFEERARRAGALPGWLR